MKTIDYQHQPSEIKLRRQTGKFLFTVYQPRRG
jgi:hypothetical protein